MSAASDSLAQLLARFEKLSLRERVLVSLAALVVPVVLWNSFFFQPLLVRRRTLQTRMRAARGQLSQVRGQTEALLARQKVDPNRENRRLLQRLQQDNRRLDARLHGVTLGLISPREMPAVLEDLLKREGGLRLVEMKNLPPEPLLPPSKSSSEKAAVPSEVPILYRHGLKMEFEGSYLDTLRYLQTIEGLSRRLYWDDFEFKVQRYPKARVTITVHTLNLDKGWIGV